MKSLIYLAAFVAAIAVSAGMADEIDTLPAQSAALVWLEKVDAGAYGTSWDEGAEFFRKALTRENWEKALVAVRTPLGAVVNRKVRSVAYAKNLPNAPEGDYVVIQFQTQFGERLFVETVTPMKEPDGRWRVSGYYIR